jgi:DHA2 family methylenomycin A resistance protein-like MFS transporter
MVPGLMMIPAGMGLAVPPMTTSILSSVEKARAGTASAILNAARQVGGALGVAVYGAIAGEHASAGLAGGTRLALATSAALLLCAAYIAHRSGRAREAAHAKANIAHTPDAAPALHATEI